MRPVTTGDAASVGVARSQRNERGGTQLSVSTSSGEPRVGAHRAHTGTGRAEKQREPASRRKPSSPVQRTKGPR